MARKKQQPVSTLALTTGAPFVVRRVALGLVRRADKVAIQATISPGRATVIEVPKTVARAALRRLPLGSQVAVEDVFGTLVLGV